MHTHLDINKLNLVKIRQSFTVQKWCRPYRHMSGTTTCRPRGGGSASIHFPLQFQQEPLSDSRCDPSRTRDVICTAWPDKNVIKNSRRHLHCLTWCCTGSKNAIKNSWRHLHCLTWCEFKKSWCRNKTFCQLNWKRKSCVINYLFII